jgi:hypothetical protein
VVTTLITRPELSLVVTVTRGTCAFELVRPSPPVVAAGSAVLPAGGPVGLTEGTELLLEVEGPSTTSAADSGREGLPRPFVAAHAGTASTTATATPPITGRRRTSGLGARCLPT